MEVVILPGNRQIASLAADAVQALLRRKPDAVLGLATGSSPLPIYDELAARHDRGLLDFSRVQGFLLDEYVGLEAGHPESYREVIRRDFAGRVNIPLDNVHGPDGSAPDIPAACRAYEDAIRESGGVDLQLLGLGTDGHIGFNEPGSSRQPGGGAPPRADPGPGHNPRIPPRRARGDRRAESAGGP